MSNFLAIATVTATLRDLLQNAVGQDVTGANVTTLRPDQSNAALPTRGVNLYLYQVTPNVAWRNTDLPTRSGDGRLLQRPRVALDLHYLLTFYGDDNEQEAQRLLGSVARTLHTQPLLTPANIAATRQAALAGDPAHFLGDSNLADEVESVKLMPLSLSLEELSKLWSVFFQTTYTLSTAYLASTVLIEEELSPQQPLPVRVRNITATPFQQAQIERVVLADAAAEPVLNAPVQFNDSALILGQRLAGAVRTVHIGETEVTPANVTHNRIRLALTSTDLRAGLQGVQLAYVNGSESNAVALVLRPRITINAANVTAGRVPVALQPAVGRRQRVTLYLNEFNAPNTRAPRAFTFGAPAHNGIGNPAQESTTAIDFAIAHVPAGNYLVHVQVAGADSLLTTDVNDRYNGPLVIIP